MTKQLPKMNPHQTEPGSWGIYPWFEENGIDLIHPNDLDNMRSLCPQVQMFEVVESDANSFVSLKHNRIIYRVKPSQFVPVSAPSKTFGDVVRFMKSGTLRAGTIIDIRWHFKESRPYYILELEGKRLSKRYWDSDFV